MDKWRKRQTHTYTNYTIIVHRYMRTMKVYLQFVHCIMMIMMMRWVRCRAVPAKGDELKTKSHYLAITSLSSWWNYNYDTRNTNKARAWITVAMWSTDIFCYYFTKRIQSYIYTYLRIFHNKQFYYFDSKLNTWFSQGENYALWNGKV